MKGWVPQEKAKPVVDRLVFKLGSEAEITNQLNLKRDYFNSVNGEGFPSKIYTKMVNLLAEIESEVRMSGAGDAEVVRPEPLGSIVREWITNYANDRPLYTGQSGYTQVAWNFIGPLQALSYRTKSSYDGTVVNVRKINGIARNEFKFISLILADRLMVAMDQHDRIATGEIEVIPNPNWSMERWLAYMSERGCR